MNKELDSVVKHSENGGAAPKKEGEEGRIKPILVWSRRKRMGVLALSAVLLLVGISLLLAFLEKKTKEEDVPLFSYELSADSEYRVHLKENSLYPEEWLEADRVYSAKLTDYIEASFHTKLSGAGELNAIVHGNYSISTVLEGSYLVNEEKKQVYMKSYPIKEGEIPAGAGASGIDDTVQIRPEEYMGHFAEIENEIGGSPEKEAYLLFSGSYQIEAEGQEPKTEEFSEKLNLPNADSALYMIKKSEPVQNSGALSETRTVEVPPEKGRTPLALLLILLSVGLGLFTFYLTRDPDEGEVEELRLRAFLRKYGSRIVMLRSGEEELPRGLNYLRDMDSLLLLSEELRQPVTCSIDERGLPLGRRFLLRNGEESYCYEISEASTTKGVDDIVKKEQESH